MNKSSSITEQIPIARKCAWLSEPSVWPGNVDEVSVIETRMSFVFLAGNFAYKLKKPIQTALMDFRSIERRKANCNREVKLNRRLAPNIYLGCLALRLDNDNLTLDGNAEPIDWLVVMRRLDSRAMLDTLIADDAVRIEQVDKLAAVLLRFYSSEEAVDITVAEQLDRFRGQFTQDMSMIDQGFDLPATQVNAVHDIVQEILSNPPPWIIERVKQRRIVEGHGDMRLEHICMTDVPVVIDCLEFDHSLRLVDPLEELAALVMECERVNSRWIGDRLLDHYSDKRDDPADRRLLNFYVTCKACLRTRLALGHVQRGTLRDQGRWLPLAHQYFERAVYASHELASQLR